MFPGKEVNQRASVESPSPVLRFLGESYPSMENSGEYGGGKNPPGFRR